MAAAGVHTAEQAGHHIRLGTNLSSDLGDLGRIGDDVPTTPTIHAGGDLPSSSLGDHLPGGTADHLPSSRLSTDTPTNSVDTHTHTPAGTPEHTVPGPRTDDPAPGSHTTDTAPGHDLPSGGNDSLPGHGSERPTGGSALDTPSGAGDDAAHSGHGTTQHAREADQHRAEYEAARQKPADERTPEEPAAITREHVRLANEDPAWRAEHYDKWRLGKRNQAEELVDGQLLPKLVEKPDGTWITADDLPYANPEQYHLEDVVRGRDTVDPNALAHLDKVSAKRFAGMQLTNAEKAFEANPTDETAHALAQAQEHLNQVVGEGVSNNSELGEKLGEEAARHHMMKEAFPEPLESQTSLKPQQVQEVRPALAGRRRQPHHRRGEGSPCTPGVAAGQRALGQRHHGEARDHRVRPYHPG